MLTYSAFLSWRGIFSYFTHDDGLNLVRLHGYWHLPFSKLVRSTLLVFTTEYRPVGGLVYRTLYALFGFDPFPFRIACYGLLGANLLIAYLFFRYLADARIAAVAAAVISYHASLSDLYFSSGTLYELLCFGFYTGTLAAYCQAQQKSGRGRVLWILAAIAMYGLSLGAKEMAVTLPAILIAMEGTVLKRSPLSLTKRLAYISPFLLMAAGVSLVKMTSRNEMSGNPIYAVHLSWSHISHAYSHYLRLLLYRPEPLGSGAVVALCTAVLSVGIALRRSLYTFGILFFIITLLPVAIIPPRNGFVMYIPLIGVGISAGELIVWLWDKLDGFVREKLSKTKRFRRLNLEEQAILLCVIVLAGLLPWHLQARRTIEPAVLKVHQTTRSFVQQITAQLPAPIKGTRILIVDDPFSVDDWTLPFLLRLRYDDPLFWAERTKNLPRVDENDLSLYDYICSISGNAATVTRNDRKFTAVQIPTNVTFHPAQVEPGKNYRVMISRYRDVTVDVAFRLRFGGRNGDVGVARRWCTLDAKGVASLRVPADHPAAVVVIEAIRPVNGPWTPAQGEIEITP